MPAERPHLAVLLEQGGVHLLPRVTFLGAPAVDMYLRGKSASQGIDARWLEYGFVDILRDFRWDSTRRISASRDDASVISSVNAQRRYQNRNVSY